MSSRKLIITLHANGPSKATNPHCAYTPEEIAAQAVECWEAGASAIHYHICDPQTGAPSADVKLFAETERRIRAACDIITFPTLGALDAPSEGRVGHIVELANDPQTRPDCIPVDITTTNLDSFNAETRTFNSFDRVYANTTRTMMEIAAKVKAVGVKPVPMFWDIAGVRVAEKLVEMGVFDEPMFCEASVYGEPYLGFGHPATVKGMEALLDFFPPQADWRCTVSVIGANAFPLVGAAIERGCDVALGLHDYAYPELGFPDNTALIARVADMARAAGREVATAAEAREILGMQR